MNPYSNSKKAGAGQKIVNGVIVVLLLAVAAGVTAVAVAQKNQIAGAVNGMLGDNEKVTFTQSLKVSDLKASDANGSFDNGVFTVENASGTSKKVGAFTVSYFQPHRFFFSSFKAVSTKALGSGVYLSGGPGEYFAVTSELNVWKTISGSYNDYRNYDDSFTNSFAFPSLGNYSSLSSKGFFAAPGDVAKFKDFMFVDLSPLGLHDSSEAFSVWAKLAGADYFEGDKTFTKGQIKKAIADWEAEQKALAASAAAATSSKASA